MRWKASQKVLLERLGVCCVRRLEVVFRLCKGGAASRRVGERARVGGHQELSYGVEVERRRGSAGQGGQVRQRKPRRMESGAVCGGVEAEPGRVRARRELEVFVAGHQHVCSGVEVNVVGGGAVLQLCVMECRRHRQLSQRRQLQRLGQRVWLDVHSCCPCGRAVCLGRPFFCAFSRGHRAPDAPSPPSSTLCLLLCQALHNYAVFPPLLYSSCSRSGLLPPKRLSPQGRLRHRHRLATFTCAPLGAPPREKGPRGTVCPIRTVMRAATRVTAIPTWLTVSASDCATYMLYKEP